MKCGAIYGGSGSAVCQRNEGHPPISEDGIGHSTLSDKVVNVETAKVTRTPVSVQTADGYRHAKYQLDQHVTGRVVAPSANDLIGRVVAGAINNFANPYGLDRGHVRITLDPEYRDGIAVTAWIDVEPGVTVVNIDTLNTPETVTRTLPVADNTIRPLPSLVVSERTTKATMNDILARYGETESKAVNIDKLIEEVKKYPSPNPQLITFYEMGRKGIIPFQWKRFAKLLDPEYAEYLRLQKKFS